MSAKHMIEIATPKSDILVTPGDVYHQTDTCYGTNRQDRWMPHTNGVMENKSAYMCISFHDNNDKYIASLTILLCNGIHYFQKHATITSVPCKFVLISTIDPELII